MKLYQLVNDSGYPASIHENDLAVFESREDAQDCIDQMVESGVNHFEGVVIREVREFSEIATVKSDMLKRKKCYLETHYVVVDCITHGLADESPVLMELYAAQGRAAMWELAETLTDKFEEQNRGREWDGDWEEAVWEFVGKELEELKNKRT